MNLTKNESNEINNKIKREFDSINQIMKEKMIYLVMMSTSAAELKELHLMVE